MSKPTKRNPQSVIRLYSLVEAAQACGKSKDTLKKHIYRTKFFSHYGAVKGNSLVFTASDIVAMRLWFRVHGRRGKHAQSAPDKI